MKTIGLLGGMSYESSSEYYKKINELVNKAMGDCTSAKIIMYSFDFEHISQLQNAGEWGKLTDLLAEKACDLARCGADFIAICTNTMHMMADDIEARAGVEVLHIAKATAQAINKEGIDKVALLGTKFTMTGDFYSGILNDSGVEVIIPCEADMDVVHDTIYNELVVGVISDESRCKFIEIIDRLKHRGAKGVVLGCTEIPLLIKQENVDIPVFDTMDIHCEAISRKAVL